MAETKHYDCTTKKEVRKKSVVRFRYVCTCGKVGPARRNKRAAERSWARHVRNLDKLGQL